ncbi:MAG: hypothetical protein HY764_00035 [Candidatus Portnoybacteria bacterium]|nr:hypothetical protein [Candidatus Portnoybacteria bacterium]
MKKFNLQKGVAKLPIILAVLAILIGVAAFIFFFDNIRNSLSPASQLEGSNQGTSQQQAPKADKTFTVVGGNYEFLPKEIRVEEGDRVRINFASVEGTHNWGIDEFDIRTRDAQTGLATGVEFVANQVGVFEFYSSVGDDRQRGMEGRVIVEAK